MLNTMKLIAMMGLVLFSVNATANPVSGNTCPDPTVANEERTATLTNSQECAYGLGNPDATDLGGYWAGDTWIKVSELTGDGTDSYLTVDGGSWGNIPTSGTWSISDSFWETYEEAVISMHVGEGSGNPDHWAWLIVDQANSGDWSLYFTDPCQVVGGCAGGGGLSNLKLWGRGTGTGVPAPGVLGLMALGLFGITFARRIARRRFTA